MPTLPLTSSLRGYRPEWLRYDLTSGLAIAAVGLPSAIAYPALAGLPPEVGIYASIMSVLGYALLGSSRQLIVGPDAGTVTVLAAVLVSFGLSSTVENVMASAAIAGVGERIDLTSVILPSTSTVNCSTTLPCVLLRLSSAGYLILAAKYWLNA